MIDYWFFIPACFAINLAFGPNNLMALTNAAQNGVGFAFLASIGRLLAFIPMIIVSALGLGIILSTSALVFTTVKVIGAGYLIYLGVKIWRSSNAMKDSDLTASRLSLPQAFVREGLVAFGNPKAILVFAAFFPQFIVADAYVQSYLLVAVIFLLLEVLAILVYGVIGRIAAKSSKLNLRWFQRASGIGMVTFGGLLLMTQRPA
jgi:threonine/homoserine/homoserine lactone efflux protein